MAQRSFRTFLKLVSAPLWLCVAVFSLHAGAATLNVTSLAETGAGTLRDQVAAAAANDTVAFTVTGTIILASPIVISRALFIAGPGNGTVVISGNNTQLINVTTAGVATISGLVLQNGAAADKGGAVLNQGSLSLDNMVITNNSAVDGGGAIYNVSTSGTTGQLSISNSEISGNSVTGASGIGGGAILSNSTTGTDAVVTITNSTITGNTANANRTGPVGGGIYFANGALRIFSSTIAANTAGTAGANIHQATLANTLLSIANSIIANGTVTAGGAPAADSDIFQTATATISSAGYNIVRNRSAASGYSGNDAPNLTNPSLGALAANGGATRTMLPAAGSLALGYVPAASCLNAASVALTRDQRGVARPSAANTCDAGATETVNIVVSPATLSNGVVNGAYSTTFTAAGGAAPYTFSSTGTLPTGLTLSSAGLLSTTASGAGTFNFVVIATDANLETGSRSFAVTIAKAAQTIAFGVGPTVVAGGTGTVSAIGGAGSGAITYSTASTACTVNATTGVVTGVAVGACAITANKATDANYLAATASQSITIGQGSQAITFGVAPTVVVGGAGTVVVNGGAGTGAISYSTASTNCSVVANTGLVTGTSVGACAIDAVKAADANYLAALQITQNLNIGKGSQVIAFGTAPNVSVGGTGTAVASGGAGTGAITYSTLSAACSVNATSGVVTGISAASCAIDAVKATDANYLAAPQVTQTITIGKAAQAIVFGAAPTVIVGGTGTVSASGGAGTGAITYSTASATCSVAAATGVVIGTAAGACAIDAVKATDANYAASPQITQNLTIGKAAQAITFGAAPTVVAGGTGTVSASGGAGTGAVSYSTASATCSVAAATGVVTGISVGACIIDAVKATDANYFAAPQVSQSLTIGQGSQTLVFGAAPAVAVGSIGTVTVTGGRGTGTLSFSTLSSTCSVVAGTGVVTGIATGACVIRADKAGDTNFTAAVQVSQSITIGVGAQTISGFSPATAAAVNPTPVVLLATGGASGNPVTFSTISNPAICTVTGAAVTYTGLGLCTLRASQVGNANYAAAADVNVGVTVGVGTQVISFPPQATLVQELVVNGSFAINPLATGGASGNAVTYTSTSPTVCTVAGTVVTMLATGACNIAANQLGNANYTAAATVIRGVTIDLSRPIVTSGVSGAANGTISPSGAREVARNSVLDFTITANPQYVARVSSTCGGSITTSAAFVPQGAGANNFRTDAVNSDCSVMVSFEAVNPTITISGNATVTPLNATPAQTFSEVGRSATFTADLRGAIGVLNFFNTATTPVFISFQADGVTIAGCAHQPITRVYSAESSVTQASCITNALALGNRIITASFSGDAYNFPATTSATATPTQALTHVVIAVGAPPPVVVVPPVVIPPIVLPPGSTTLPNVPVSLPPITLTLRPMAAPAATPSTSSNPAAANGTVSPYGTGGIVEVSMNAVVDLTITANPRYLAIVTGSCGGRIITSRSLVPQGAGSNTYRTAEIGGQCTVVVSFIPALPTITVSGSGAATPVNTTPVMSTSLADQPATFVATMRQAVGVVGLNNTSPSTVFISFYADGLPIVGCEQQVISLAFGLDTSFYQATCSTASLIQGTHKITVNFSGDKYNFPAITDSNATPTAALTHVVQ